MKKIILIVIALLWTTSGLLQARSPKEAAEIEEHYKKFGDKLPEELKAQLETLKANLAKM